MNQYCCSSTPINYPVIALKNTKKHTDLIVSGGHKCVRLEDEVGDLLGALVGQLPRQQLGLGKLLHVPKSNAMYCKVSKDNY